MNTFAVISGDKRQNFITNYLNAHNFHASVKSNFSFHKDEIIICNTPFSKDGIYLNCDFYSHYPIDTFIRLLKPGQLVFGGNIPTSTVSKGLEKNVLFVDFLKDKHLIWENAALTAEGLIAKMITVTDFSLSSSNVLIIGYGNCGKNIASRLKSFHSKIFIYDHTKEHQTLAKDNGYIPIKYDNLSDELKNFHIIINTVPSNVLNDFHLTQINKSCMLFEIASKPYGLTPEMIKKHNLSLITCPGIPGITAPKTAGEIIAKSIISYLERKGINGSQF